MEFVKKGPVMTLGSNLISEEPPILEKHARKYFKDMLEGMKYRRRAGLRWHANFKAFGASGRCVDETR